MPKVHLCRRFFGSPEELQVIYLRTDDGDDQHNFC